MTDHRALTSLMTSQVVLNCRLQQFALKLIEYNFDIVYRPGVDNGNADGLSRQSWSDSDVPSSVAVPGSDRSHSRA